ncbi:E3 ubiquitin protein ligase DRIP2-like [Gossypium australe]|uniref:E3 ubiquitin protein ligase DRIP2-like n=1 Tax=Gossypium australe TaxID=47621 RepID=A0A5B6VVR1_9ROSI|nr:E3 ubiquitin protein ligase DRIP2-like [Gossypium australe]
MIRLFQHVPCLLEIVLNDILHFPLRTFNLNIFKSLPDFIKWFQDRTYFPSTDFCMLLEDQVKLRYCAHIIGLFSYGNRDGKMPVSFIQKYLVKKLDLSSEAEVEIMCRGQPVLPSLQLHNLVDLWFRTASTAKKVPASVGSSAKDFVMVLSYCRKVHAP